MYKTGVPLRIVFTLRKMKTVTPSLKEPVEMNLNPPTGKSKIVTRTGKGGVVMTPPPWISLFVARF